MWTPCFKKLRVTSSISTNTDAECQHSKYRTFLTLMQCCYTGAADRFHLTEHTLQQ